MITFRPALIRTLSTTLPNLVGAANAGIGKSGADHQAEHVVQHLMRSALAPHLPCPTLIRENQKLSPPALNALIPDLIIDRVGGGYWGVFELKTLLCDDQLGVDDVNKDLNKLCEYKKYLPDTAAIFALVGSKRKLGNSARQKAWASSKIRYEKTLFTTRTPAPQMINADFAAIPCGSSPSDSDVQTFLWEVQPVTNLIVSSAFYSFQAEMTP